MKTDHTTHKRAMHIALNLLARYLYDKSPEETFLSIGYLIVEMKKHYSFEEIDYSDWEQLIKEAVSMNLTKITKQ